MVLPFCVAFVLVLFGAQPLSGDLSRETNRQQCRHLIGLGLLWVSPLKGAKFVRCETKRDQS